MNVLITGINGFIGRYIYQKIKNDCEITGVYHNNIDYTFFNPIQLVHSGNIESVNAKPDVVVLAHAAVSSGNVTLSNDELYDSNVKFTQKMVDLFPDSYIVYLSSVSVYGNHNERINENSLLHPLSTYAVSKLWGERVVLSKAKSSVLRLTSVFGEMMKENTIIPHYVNQALKKNKIDVWGDGSRRQNYIHANDVAEYVASLIKNKHKGVFLAASSDGLSNLELANIISTHTGATIEFVNEDKTPSVEYDNSLTIKKLSINQSSQIEKQVISYLEWKRKQY